MSDFLTELEEDIREERLINLWHQYGNLIIGVALAIIVGTTGYTLWGHFKTKQQLAHYTSLSHALNLLKEGKTDEALQAFQTLGKEKDGYGKLAHLYEAALLSHPNPLYEEIIANNKTDPALGNLPKILEASHALGHVKAMQALEPLAAPHNAWAPLSLELLALAALQKGDLTKAADYYRRTLKEETLTASEQARLRMMLAQIDLSHVPAKNSRKK